MKMFLLFSVLTSMSVFLMSSSLFAKNGEYIIKIKDTKEASFLLEKSGAQYGKIKSLEVDLGKFYLFSPASANKLKELSLNSAVEYIEPNYKYRLFDSNIEKSERDSYYPKQWGLKNTGSNSGSWGSGGVAGVDINAEKAWEITTGDREMIVAVIDTGVDFNHPDLKNNMWTNEAELNGESGVDDDNNGYTDDIYGYDFGSNKSSPIDKHGHGTHCAGVIGGVHDNGIGVKGVMAEVRIMALKFIGPNGEGETDDAIMAIDYAVKMGAKVLSNSWGGPDNSQALKDTIKKAQEKGVFFVAAAGNNSGNNDVKPMYPASYDLDNIISVGSISGTGKKSYFSNYGKKTVDVFAPGSSIVSTYKNGRYSYLSGTSMAAPFVSGILGLLVGHEPDILLSDAKRRLIESCVQSNQLANSVAQGRVDAFNLLTN